MVSFVAEVPGYLQGVNPASIEAVTRRLAKLLKVHLDLAPLRAASTAWELQVSQIVEQNEERPPRSASWKRPTTTNCCGTPRNKASALSNL